MGSECQSTGQKGKQKSEITQIKLGVRVVRQQVCLYPFCTREPKTGHSTQVVVLQELKRITSLDLLPC